MLTSFRNLCWAIPANIPLRPWTTLNWVPKNFRICKKDSSSLCRIPNPADSKYLGIPEFCKTLNEFPGIPVKIPKIWGNSWNSSRADQAFITGFPMSSMGGVWIFSGIAHSHITASSEYQKAFCEVIMFNISNYVIRNTSDDFKKGITSPAPWNRNFCSDNFIFVIFILANIPATATAAVPEDQSEIQMLRIKNEYGKIDKSRVLLKTRSSLILDTCNMWSRMQQIRKAGGKYTLAYWSITRGLCRSITILSGVLSSPILRMLRPFMKMKCFVFQGVDNTILLVLLIKKRPMFGRRE